MDKIPLWEGWDQCVWQAMRKAVLWPFLLLPDAPAICALTKRANAFLASARCCPLWCFGCVSSSTAPRAAWSSWRRRSWNTPQGSTSTGSSQPLSTLVGTSPVFALLADTCGTGGPAQLLPFSGLHPLQWHSWFLAHELCQLIPLCSPVWLQWLFFFLA